MRTSFLAALATFTLLSAADDTFPPFEIAHTQLIDDVGGNTSLTFIVHDPSKLTNATQGCFGSWRSNSSDYPSSVYQPCSSNGSFAWRLGSFESQDSFVISLEHAFQDDDMGSYPYNYVANYGSATFNSSNIHCEGLGGKVTCNQVPGPTVKAPITRTAGK